MSIIKTAKKVAARIIDYIPVLNRALLASTGYLVITKAQAHAPNGLLDGWHSNRSAERQCHAYEKLLADLRAGRPRIDFDIAVRAVKATGLSAPSLLDVGCGNGYYSEVFRELVPGVRYTGLDYSEAMVKSAKQRYPRDRFDVGDATALTDPDGAFDIVFNGVSLMHILDYQRAVSEAARVAGSFLILHGVPVFDAHETTYFRKYAYGEPVVEIVFSRRELEDLMTNCGFMIREVWSSIDYDVYGAVGVHSQCLTYLAGRR